MSVISEPNIKRAVADQQTIIDKDKTVAIWPAKNALLKDKIIEEDIVGAYIEDIRLFGCYASPNSQIEDYKIFLAKIERSVRKDKSKKI